MSVHIASTHWKRETPSFDYDSYNRDHVWRIDGLEIDASAAPDFLGKAGRVDPEQAFVASLSSCHMLTFLALASRKRFTLDRYEDNAQGTLEKNGDGKLAMTRVVLRPRVVFSGSKQPSIDEITAMHAKAHQHCFIANSVITEVQVEPDHPNP